MIKQVQICFDYKISQSFNINYGYFVVTQLSNIKENVHFTEREQKNKMAAKCFCMELERGSAPHEWWCVWLYGDYNYYSCIGGGLYINRKTLVVK